MTKHLHVIGGGQLGRMLLQAAIDLDIQLHILDPDPDAPCRPLAASFTVGSRTDYQTVYAFGKGATHLTIEIESVNVEALEQLEAEGVKVFPQPRVIKIIQDKRLQKQFYAAHGLPTAPFVLLDHKTQLYEHAAFLPAFQKLAKDGYDGRGVMPLRTPADFDRAFEQPSLLEQLVPFEKELSVIVARNESGELATFPAVELVFNPVYNLVDYLFSPAHITETVRQRADALARATIAALDMVGILAVEMFLLPDGSLLLNESAPRPHNSGHHTIKANRTSQYEQHLRAVFNLPLGDPRQQVAAAAMLNIVGAEGYAGEVVYEGIREALAESGVYVHLYGKRLTKQGRKMGHLTIVGDALAAVRHTVEKLKPLVVAKTADSKPSA